MFFLCSSTFRQAACFLLMIHDADEPRIAIKKKSNKNKMTVKKKKKNKVIKIWNTYAIKNAIVKIQQQ